MPITEEEIEKTLHWLISNSTKAAQARANRIYCEEFRKSLKSILMSESNETTESGRERSAYASAKYLEHLEALKAAVFEDQRYQWLLAAAEAKIGMWRSLEASRRAQEKVT